ncbi:MAG: flagellar motor protein MotB [Candidatus Latescibacteria bacterium]|nr:flagellar motor protein MotB [Candidatus Latescibacterota bacterium]
MSDAKGGQRPIVIKKIKKGHGGHHGGAWKLAYADYVTAMMAFFLLMWLLAMASPQTKQGLAEYFRDPAKVSLTGGASTGDRTSLIPGGGESITREMGHGKKTDTRNKQKEAEQLQQLKLELEQMIKKDPQLQQFKDQFKVEITEEGLRVQIVDQEGRPMFGVASSRMESYASEAIRKIAQTINQMPNKISITGHTDALPYSGGLSGYSNWELSADRANAARQAVVAGGLEAGKVLRVVGVGSSIPYNREDPFDSANRRISIIIMNKESEDAVVHNAESGFRGAAAPEGRSERKSPARSQERH